jgi:hypothetical protein
MSVKFSKGSIVEAVTKYWERQTINSHQQANLRAGEIAFAKVVEKLQVSAATEIVLMQFHRDCVLEGCDNQEWEVANLVACATDIHNMMENRKPIQLFPAGKVENPPHV